MAPRLIMPYRFGTAPGFEFLRPRKGWIRCLEITPFIVYFISLQLGAMRRILVSVNFSETILERLLTEQIQEIAAEAGFLDSHSYQIHIEILSPRGHIFSRNTGIVGG